MLMNTCPFREGTKRTRRLFAFNIVIHILHERLVFRCEGQCDVKLALHCIISFNQANAYNVITQETEILTIYGSNGRLLSNFIVILKCLLYQRLSIYIPVIDVLKLQSQNLKEPFAFIAVRA